MGISERDVGYEKGLKVFSVDTNLFKNKVSPYLDSIMRKKLTLKGNFNAYFFEVGGLTTTPKGNQMELKAMGCQLDLINKLEELAKN